MEDEIDPCIIPRCKITSDSTPSLTDAAIVHLNVVIVYLDVAIVHPNVTNIYRDVAYVPTTIYATMLQQFTVVVVPTASGGIRQTEQTYQYILFIYTSTSIAETNRNSSRELMKKIC